MIVNVNARVTGNGGIFVQYQEEGKAKDAVFADWSAFVAWLKEKVAP